jgi:hypothetical protein
MAREYPRKRAGIDNPRPAGGSRPADPPPQLDLGRFKRTRTRCGALNCLTLILPPLAAPSRRGPARATASSFPDGRLGLLPRRWFEGRGVGQSVDRPFPRNCTWALTHHVERASEMCATNRFGEGARTLGADDSTLMRRSRRSPLESQYRWKVCDEGATARSSCKVQPEKIRCHREFEAL